uniref:Uncharacterized protein n=1 Tax=Arion vulgaris TaxID=1028688 RepID=A0A0B7AQJ6_9EUPU
MWLCLYIINNTRVISIRGKVGTELCLNYTKKQRMKWSSHLIRMQPNSTVYRVFYIRKEEDG